MKGLSRKKIEELLAFDRGARTPKAKRVRDLNRQRVAASASASSEDANRLSRVEHARERCYKRLQGEGYNLQPWKPIREIHPETSEVAELLSYATTLWEECRGLLRDLPEEQTGSSHDADRTPDYESS